MIAGYSLRDVASLVPREAFREARVAATHLSAYGAKEGMEKTSWIHRLLLIQWPVSLLFFPPTQGFYPALSHCDIHPSRSVPLVKRRVEGKVGGEERGC